MNSEAMDPAALDRLRNAGGDDLVTGLVNMYLQGVGEKMQAIQEALNSEDLEEIERRSHMLVSSAGHLGGVLVSNLSKQIELAARDKNMEKVQLLIPELVSAEKDFSDYLRNEGKADE